MVVLINERLGGTLGYGEILSVKPFPLTAEALQQAWALSFEGEATGHGQQIDVYNSQGEICGYQSGGLIWRVHDVT